MVRANINMERFWDCERVCRCPHKGWYLHYYDNAIVRYGKDDGDFLTDFPGLDHLYFRLAWSYLEPKEGEYNWKVIDDVIEKWLPFGYTFSFRITCKETNDHQFFSTPEWVKDAGVPGTFVEGDEGQYWEPDYGNELFLEKLENFHRQFAARYDGKPWVEYIDVGSYGEWGEGHTYFGTGKVWPVSVVKKIFDIHFRCYKETLIVISYSFILTRDGDEGSGQEILDYMLSHGAAIRNDSISVAEYADTMGASSALDPELFELFWRNNPVNLENAHYHMAKWDHGKYLAAAVDEMHATFAGFHGYGR